MSAFTLAQATTITDQALVAAANLADRYISDRHLPDKAIDLIDEAGSRLRIKRMQTPPDYKDLENKLADVVKRKKEAVEAQRFEEAGNVKQRRLASARGPDQRNDFSRRDSEAGIHKDVKALRSLMVAAGHVAHFERGM